MDALNGFEYKHNNSITLDSGIGKIELTYQTQEGQREDNKAFDSLFEAAGVDMPYNEPARNEFSFFKATLLDGNGKIAHIAYAVLPDEAVKEIYRWNAVRQMEAEFYPQPYNY